MAVITNQTFLDPITEKEIEEKSNAKNKKEIKRKNQFEKTLFVRKVKTPQDDVDSSPNAKKGQLETV